MTNFNQTSLDGLVLDKSRVYGNLSGLGRTTEDKVLSGLGQQ